MIHPHTPPLSPPLDEKRRVCVLCHPFYKRVEFRFDSGSVEPTAGETITGATSGDTGKVESVILESGSWANGDATGTVELSSATGLDDNGLWGEDDEALNGSTGGNDMMTLNDNGVSKGYGRLWPESQLILRDGKWYCPEHYRFRFRYRDLVQTPFRVEDR